MGCDIHSHTGRSSSSSSVAGTARRRRRGRVLPFSATIGSLAAASFLALGSSGAVAHSYSARAARTLSLKESAALRLDNKHGVLLKEHGTAKGTLGGPLYLQLKVTSTRSVSATVQVYPHGGGSLSGAATASYHVAGAYARFSGRLNITKGSGRFSKARGKGLSFSGTIKRGVDSINVYVNGRLSY